MTLMIVCKVCEAEIIPLDEREVSYVHCGGSAGHTVILSETEDLTVPLLDGYHLRPAVRRAPRVGGGIHRPTSAAPAPPPPGTSRAPIAG